MRGEKVSELLHQKEAGSILRSVSENMNVVKENDCLVIDSRIVKFGLTSRLSEGDGHGCISKPARVSDLLVKFG